MMCRIIMHVAVALWTCMALGAILLIGVVLNPAKAYKGNL